MTNVLDEREQLLETIEAMTREIKKLREALIAIEALGEDASETAYQIADDAVKSHNHRTTYIFC